MNTQPCEAFQISLSALIDGELEPVEVVPTVDHLVDCAACRSFYGRARAIDGLALDALTAGLAEPAPEAVWQRIQAGRESGSCSGRSRSAGWPAWASALAASLALAVGLAIVGLEGTRQTADRPGEVIVAEGGGSMSEQRFVELAQEVLQADSRYQREMLEVMRAATSRGLRREGTLETDDPGREERSQAAESAEALEATRRPNRDTRPGPRS